MINQMFNEQIGQMVSGQLPFFYRMQRPSMSLNKGVARLFCFKFFYR